MTTSDTGAQSPDLGLLKALCKALDDKKAGDLKLIAVADISSVTDYIVIATGLAEPHLRALRIAAEQVLDAAGAKIASIDTRQDSGWLIVDAYQVMVHFFTVEMRKKYALEQLWRDGHELSVADLLADKPLAPKKPAKPRVKPGKEPTGMKSPKSLKKPAKKRGKPASRSAKPAKSAAPAKSRKKK